MKKEDKFFSKILFKNLILQHNGQAFEDFFVLIMTKSNSEFQPVKAYGNIGDKKNDGFIRKTGTYYQVFAPSDITKQKTITDAVNKMESDFKGLYSNWNGTCKIERFFFVINDKYKGLAPPIIQKVIELDNDPQYSEVEISTFTAKDLERIFDELEDSDIQDVVGFIPNISNELIEYEALNEVVSYLLNVDLPEGFDEKLIVPDFIEKIKFNDLSKQIETKLMNGSYQEGSLTRFFNDNPGVKEILQQKFHALYVKSCETIPDIQENVSDCRFLYILGESVPKKTLPMYTCVWVLMAYYFSTCDIFEEPR